MGGLYVWPQKLHMSGPNPSLHAPIPMPLLVLHFIMKRHDGRLEYPDIRKIKNSEFTDVLVFL